MQFKFVERGSDRVIRLSTTFHRINRAHPLFCEVRLHQDAASQPQWFFKFTFDQPVE